MKGACERFQSVSLFNST